MFQCKFGFTVFGLEKSRYPGVQFALSNYLTLAQYPSALFLISGDVQFVAISTVLRQWSLDRFLMRKPDIQFQEALE